MPLARKVPAKLPPVSTSKVTAAPAPAPAPDGSYTDSHGVQFVGDEVTISISRSIKLSRMYQGAGVEIGLSFKTKASMLDSAMRGATDKVDALTVHELTRVNGILDQIVSAANQS